MRFRTPLATSSTPADSLARASHPQPFSGSRRFARARTSLPYFMQAPPMGFKEKKVRHLNRVSSQSSKESHAKSSPRYTELPCNLEKRERPFSPITLQNLLHHLYRQTLPERRSSDLHRSKLRSRPHAAHTCKQEAERGTQKRRGLHTTFDTEAPRAAGATHTRQHKSADQRAVAVSTSLESKQTSSVTHTPTLRAEKEGGGHRKAAIEETRRAPSERSETRTAFLIHRGC
jgi:hypothetical protein